MTRLLPILLSFSLLAGSAAAAATEASPRPEPRPAQAKGLSHAVLPALGRSLRPVPRPALPTLVAATSAGIRTQPSAVLTRKRGAICGDPAIRGEVLAPIAGRIRGCGVERPVRVTAVDGVPLTRPATVDCTTARALRAWVASGVKPVVGRTGGGVASIKVVADYACRTRNNQPGAKLSEHGRGRAVDVAAINLRNGASISVLNGWRDPKQGRLLRAMHKAACGPFGTVLGPDSDRFHQNHFHLDTARYRSGAYCR
ncbi:Uncharacterized conserved protein [Rhodovulum sp. ES.010]|uniref:extensin-like domain-containing protein n=1 Tax=Rhodovulum sp. ES.010 TaxID=1882821 RepID=UPI000925BB1E|nr:extensin family protein [Rhodovulum sp. ES.010]SIO45727.1 Uncharacterized conserved protein [Rhodovulum sp. ES.010]